MRFTDEGAKSAVLRTLAPSKAGCAVQSSGPNDQREA